MKQDSTPRKAEKKDAVHAVLSDRLLDLQHAIVL